MPAPGSEDEIKKGLVLSDGAKCLPAKAEFFAEDGRYYMIIEIREGKYHQVKRMAAACGTQVVSLHREKIGALELDPALAPGECRELTPDEIDLLFENS